MDSINAFVNENPDALNLEVIYSRDDEGNFFSPVFYSPTVGRFNRSENEFDQESILKPNAVCIN